MDKPIRYYSIQYLKKLTETERKNLKKMIEKGYTCCIGYTKVNEIDNDLFTQDLYKIL